MKKGRTLSFTLVSLFCVCFLSQIAFGQTIIRRQDFDANNTLPLLGVTTSGGTASQTQGDTPDPSRPADSTYGAVSAAAVFEIPGISPTSNARTFYGDGIAPDDTNTLTFAAIPPAEFVPGTNDLFVSFRIAAAGIGTSPNQGLDGNDDVTLRISLDNGVNFTNQARITGNDQSVWNYNNSVTKLVNFGGTILSKTFKPDTAGSSNDPNAVSKLILRIPDATLTNSTGLVIQVVLNLQQDNEIFAVDDFIVYQSAPTAAPANVGGRIVNSSGRGIFRAFVTATDASGQKHTAMTNPFGYYRFSGLNSGETYVFDVRKKSYTFVPQVLFLGEDLNDLNFTPIESENNFVQTSRF